MVSEDSQKQHQPKDPRFRGATPEKLARASMRPNREPLIQPEIDEKFENEDTGED